MKSLVTSNLNAHTGTSISSGQKQGAGKKPSKARAWSNILEGILKDSQTVVTGTFKINVDDLNLQVQKLASACVLSKGHLEDCSESAFDDLIEACQEILEQRPLNVKLHCVLVKALYARERYDEAKTALHHLTSIEPAVLRSDRELSVISRTIWVLDNWWLPAVFVPFVVLGQIVSDRYKMVQSGMGGIKVSELEVI